MKNEASSNKSALNDIEMMDDAERIIPNQTGKFLSF
jgi:hypothetical protein